MHRPLCIARLDDETPSCSGWLAPGLREGPVCEYDQILGSALAELDFHRGYIGVNELLSLCHRSEQLGLAVLQLDLRIPLIDTLVLTGGDCIKILPLDPRSCARD